MSLYLVTGGAGFIGSNIVGELVSRGEQVRVFDNFSTGQRKNLATLADKTQVFEGDIRSYHAVREAMEGVDYVLHQAALPSVPRSVRDPITSNEVNVVGTLNVLHAARDAKVRRLVYASSSSVYGDSETLPKSEEMCPNPLSPYAISKLAAEKYCQVFAHLYKFETVCIRYFNVFGPRQDPNSQYAAVVPKFITAIMNDRPVTIFGDGMHSRDFTYIQNVIHANLLACTAERAPGQVVNVACGARYTLLELVDRLGKLMGKTPEIKFQERRPGDVPHSLAAIAKAREYLGYEPIVQFEEGLQRTIRWYADPNSV